jgi:NADH dehydrogenase [ubiquinone] 1 alpha subcomplex assembly factor 7
MNPLQGRIRDLIAREGPLPLPLYMAMCLTDPQHGYYTTREPIGAAGDFVTAPEVSQMFGELIGVWTALAWQALGSPARLILAEAGPGRGTLMADLLRAAGRVPGFSDAVEIHLIEASPALRARQRDLLSPLAPRLCWHEALGGLPDAGAPLILIGNEFLDALPMRQFVKAGAVWRERAIGLGQDGNLAFVAGASVADPAWLPADADRREDGTIFEIAPAREAFVSELAGRIVRHGGAALLIDYGHAKSGFGDTFQAMRNHAFADPLAEPGKADLTSHVDFERTAAAARNAGCETSPVLEQGEFLLRMGLKERAETLARAAAAKGNDPQPILAQATRLAAPEEMGRLFKALAIWSGMKGVAGFG